MKKEDILFWLGIGLIFILGLADWLIPQMPAASLSEGIFEVGQGFAALMVVASRLFNKKK